MSRDGVVGSGDDDRVPTGPDGRLLGGPYGAVIRWLRGVRTDPDRRKIAVAVATLAGLGLAWIHWIGLLLAGAFVGLVGETPRRAVLGGLVVGLLVLVLHVWASPAMDAGEFLALAPAAYVTVAAGLLLPVWGSLVRYVV